MARVGVSGLMGNQGRTKKTGAEKGVGGLGMQMKRAPSPFVFFLLLLLLLFYFISKLSTIILV